MELILNYCRRVAVVRWRWTLGTATRPLVKITVIDFQNLARRAIADVTPEIASRDGLLLPEQYEAVSPYLLRH